MDVFDSIWLDIVKILREKEFISTLSSNVRNEIVEIGDEYIIVRSERPLHGIRKIREIRKNDLKIAWNILQKKGFLELQDIEPVLRGRKSITLAILALHPNITYKIKPRIRLTLHKHQP